MNYFIMQTIIMIYIPLLIEGIIKAHQKIKIPITVLNTPLEEYDLVLLLKAKV